MLRQGVQGISDLITVPGLINLDFADVRTVMKDAGSALMGIGRASGEGRATKAAQEAIASPLLEVNISGAQGVLFNVTGGASLSLFEVDEAAEIIRATADPEANIIFGTVIDERMEDDISITVIATGFDSSRKRDVVRTQTQMPAEVASELRVAREREAVREMELEESPYTAIPVTPESDGLPTAAVVAPRTDQRAQPMPARGPQAELEDLDIPAFLRRHR